MQTAMNAPYNMDAPTHCAGAKSAVAWPAIIAGAFAAVALSLVLLLLGSGLGLAIVSPWAQSGVSAVTFTATGAIWLIVTQWLASALGGYLTGRMRCRWSSAAPDEVFFRDTAHGFMAWVLATLFTVAFMATAITTVVSGTAKAVTAVAAGAAAGVGAKAADNMDGAPMKDGPMGDPIAYFTDSLFRTDGTNTAATEQGARDEASRIFIYSVKDGEVSDIDKAYLAQLVAARTGLTQEDAVKRVDNTIAQMKAAEAKLKEKADTARKTAATISIFTALSMVIGAFVAAVSAAMGGRCRDE